MALKSSQSEGDKVDIEELLDVVDKTLDRLKVLYEQYFLGSQKQPPTQIHTDVERRLRDLQQINIRNTSLRYRFATLTQKFGSYNSYWRRTLRQIENGTYVRQLAKVGRQAALTGAEVPPEILAAMTPRMREQVKRDREQALATMRRRAGEGEEAETAGDFEVDFEEAAAVIGESQEIRSQLPRGGTHKLGGDEDFDIEAFFASVTDEEVDTPPTQALPRPTSARTGAPRARTVEEPIVPSPPDSTQVVPVVPMPQQRPSTVGAQRPPGERPSQPAGAALFGTAGLQAQDRPSSAGTPAPSSPGTPAPSLPGTSAHPRPGTPPPLPRAGTQGPPPVPGRPGAPPMPRAATNAGRAPSHSEPDSTQVVPVVPPPARPGAIPAIRATGGQGAIPSVTRPTGGQAAIPSDQSASTSRSTAAQPSIGAEHRVTGPQPPVGIENRVTGPQPPVSSAPRPTAPHAAARPSGGHPVIPDRAKTEPDSTQVVPVVPMPKPAPPRPTGPVAASRPTGPVAPSQVSRPNPIQPGSSTGRTPVPVQTIGGRAPEKPEPKREPAPAKPPPGMNDADVNALYAKYVQAKKAVGEDAGPGAYGKLLKTINSQAPKIMEQYKAKGVEFSVVVKDNQVIIKAKPKT